MTNLRFPAILCVVMLLCVTGLAQSEMNKKARLDFSISSKLNIDTVYYNGKSTLALSDTILEEVDEYVVRVSTPKLKSVLPFQVRANGDTLLRLFRYVSLKNYHEFDAILLANQRTIVNQLKKIDTLISIESLEALYRAKSYLTPVYKLRYGMHDMFLKFSLTFLDENGQDVKYNSEVENFKLVKTKARALTLVYKVELNYFHSNRQSVILFYTRDANGVLTLKETRFKV